jgi:Ser/Thr protein kinase RdoA (MazF antagonist)
VAISDRFWQPITPGEAAQVLGEPAEIVSAHLRWLFAVARCRVGGRELIVKRQPPMGRDLEQLRWGHRLTNHVADRGVPAARMHRVVEVGEAWYEVGDVAAGDDAYAGVDTWEPFHSLAHSEAAGRMLAAFHAAGEGFTPARPQPQRGFVVQLDLAATHEPAAAVHAMADARPAVAEYLASVAPWEAEVEAAYGEVFASLRPAVPALPRSPLHGDWQTNNLFFRGDEVSGIIDFHQADHGPRLLDLATAVERNCFFWNRISAGEDHAFDVDHSTVLVEGYHAAAPLTATERSALPDVLATCQFEYGISFLDYYWGVERDREKADWAWHTFVLGHARWWQTPAGRAAAGEIERIAAGLA